MMSGIRLAAARVGDLAAVMRVMDAAFDPTYGEAWTGAQLLTLFALPSARVCLAWDGDLACGFSAARIARSEEHTSELQSLMRISYAVFCLKKKQTLSQNTTTTLKINICNKIKIEHN